MISQIQLNNSKLFLIFLLYSLIICSSSSATSTRINLNSTSPKRISINADGNKIVMAEILIGNIKFFEKNSSNNNYNHRILNITNFRGTKIHINEQGNRIYYLNQHYNISMFDVISLAETYISRIYCPNYDNFGWAAIDDNILVGCISYNYLSNQYQTVVQFIDKQRDTLNISVGIEWFDSYTVPIKLLKNPYRLIRPFGDHVRIYYINDQFNDFTSYITYYWNSVTQNYLKRVKFYIYNKFSNQIWRIVNSNRISVNQSYYYYNYYNYNYNDNMSYDSYVRTQDLVKIPPFTSYWYSSTKIQQLSEGNQLYTSKDGNYLVILNNIQPDKSVLKMYNLQQVTKNNGLDGVKVDLFLIDLCQITNLQINQKGDKIAYICREYFENMEMVVVEHTLGTEDKVLPCYNFLLFFSNPMYCASTYLYITNVFLTFIFLLMLIACIIALCVYRYKKRKEKQRKYQEEVLQNMKNAQRSGLQNIKKVNQSMNELNANTINALVNNNQMIKQSQEMVLN